MRKHFDMGTMIIIIITFVLFTMALFTKGFTHALLLEAGVFLVSVKLILMAYNNSVNVKSFQKEIKEIKELLKKKL
jgi:flagellar motor component MotA